MVAFNSIIPDENLIGALRVPKCGPRSSGFRGVYLQRFNNDGEAVYVGRFKYGGSFLGPTFDGRGGGKMIPGSASTQPHVTATYVARKYAEVYGERWRDVLRARKWCPWQAKYSPRRRGYVAAVWVRGRREEVVRSDGRLAVFKTYEGAKGGIQAYMGESYGEQWGNLMYRVAPPRMSPAHRTRASAMAA